MWKLHAHMFLVHIFYRNLQRSLITEINIEFTNVFHSLNVCIILKNSQLYNCKVLFLVFSLYIRYSATDRKFLSFSFYNTMFFTIIQFLKIFVIFLKLRSYKNMHLPPQLKQLYVSFLPQLSKMISRANQII